MMPLKCLWKPLIHKQVIGRWTKLRMYQADPGIPSGLSRPGLYLHVPFCKNLCPFCPYNRVEYDEDLFRMYEQAVYQEIDVYAPATQNNAFVSLYIGGGTPTVNLPGLIRIIGYLRQSFPVIHEFCIELHPSDMDDDCLFALKDAGITMISIGIESLKDPLLETIGRNHDAETALNSLRRAMRMGFKSVNADLMFVLPGQTLKDWESDIDILIHEGADQISTYPLFSFPYSDLGTKQNLQTVKRPNDRLIRAMLETTDTLLRKNGYDRCAVWSWIKPSKDKFSSITRHHYIGFGPGAASMTGNYFYVNTFDVRSYAQALPSIRPVALCIPVDRNLEMAYWLYWRVYELHVRESEFQALFGAASSLEKQFSCMLRPLSLLGLVDRNANGFDITTSGAYWIHRLQNEYSLNYINKLWGACRKEPWPSGVTL